MELVIVFLVILVAISLYSYLKVIYECVRKVKISKSDVKLSSRSMKGLTHIQVTDSAHSKANTSSKVEVFNQAPGPLPWPVLGNLALLGRYDVPFQAFTELAKKFGDVYTLTLGTTRCLIVNNLDLIREVLNQNGKYFGGRPDFLRFHKLFDGDRNNSLALCDWSSLQQKRRNLARKHCSPRDASSFFHKMSDVGCFEMQELMDYLQRNIVSGEEVEIKPLIQQTCANMFTQYMCSTRFDYEDTAFNKIVDCFDEIFWDINQGYAVDFLPWLAPFYHNHMNRIVNWSSTIRSFILERIINDRERNLDVEEPEKDFTDALLKSLLEDEDVSRDVIIFMLEDFIGGHSAIGNLVILALAYVVKNPEVGKQIQLEIDRVTDNNSRTVNLNDIESLPYTVATIYEVLRYSSSPIVPHVATEDVAIAGYGVTKGTVVIINNYELNTSEKYWEKPEQFNPERFIDRSGAEPTIKKNIPHFLPFSIGKRTCIGQNLVRGFGFIMLANILQKYDLSCKNMNTIKIYPACVAVPPNAFKLVLSSRHL